VFFAVLLASRRNYGDSTSFAPAHVDNIQNTHEQDIIDVYQRALPCVAALDMYRPVKPKLLHLLARLFRGTVTVSVSQASGLLWDDEGHIITNHHCCYSDHGKEALRIKVKLPFSKYHVSADLIGSDLQQDIAVLKIIPEHLELFTNESISLPKPLEIGSSRELQIGQTVLALGSPGGRSGTLTNGVISSLDQDVVNSRDSWLHGVIQTNSTYDSILSHVVLVPC
jgi:S1-C subfamily serine protease